MWEELCKQSLAWFLQRIKFCLFSVSTELCKEVFQICDVPLVICGGLGKLKDLIVLTDKIGINGFAAASAFHYNLLQIKEIKRFLIDYKINVRE